MSDKIKIDIVSDVVCPWCIVGYKRLEAAIKQLNLQERVEIEWQAFELNSDMPMEGENLRDHVLRKYGASLEDSNKARESIVAHGSEYGFSFDYFEEMKIVNTHDAHILLELAHEKGLQNELKQRLFSAFFTEHKDVSDREILIAEAKEIGIDPTDSSNALENPERSKEVLKQEDLWKQQGISGVPTMIFNRESAMTGAYPETSYIEVLKDLAGL